MFSHLPVKKFVIGAVFALVLANITAGSVFATTPTPNVTPTPIQIVIEEKIQVGEGNPATSGEVVDEQVTVVEEVRASGSVIDESVSVVEEVRTSGSVIDEPVTVVDEVEVDAASYGESEEDEDAGEHVDAASYGESEEDEDASEREDLRESSQSTERQEQGSTRFGECGLNAGGAASTGQVGLVMAPIFLYAWRRIEKH